MKREHEDEGVENEDNEDEIPQGQDEINQYNNQQDVDNHYDDDSSIQEQSNFLNTNEQSESGSNQMNQDFLDGTMAKRQKRSDDEEIRLLIPSKVSIICQSNYSLFQFSPPIFFYQIVCWSDYRQRWTKHTKTSY